VLGAWLSRLLNFVEWHLNIFSVVICIVFRYVQEMHMSLNLRGTKLQMRVIFAGYSRIVGLHYGTWVKF
jgi:hypothetical protein